MKSYSEFRVSTEGFLKDLQANVLEAHSELVGACSVSGDPRVRSAWERWRTMQDLQTFLRESGKAKEQRGE